MAAEIEAAKAELVELKDSILLQQVGIYEYRHPLETADEFKDRLKELRIRVRETIKSSEAILASDRFAGSSQFGV
ncbi:hypothetical protein [Granulicoccus sp. GXG6511]|uniref:hypothetical protein n=1 Tax=Granulicoccus sp. GXG6511 TaxID=3381351 RepID=UPI003D7D2B9A